MTPAVRKLLAKWIVHVMYMLTFQAHIFPAKMREELAELTADLETELKK